MERRGVQARPRMYLSFVFSFVVVLSSFSFLLVVWEAHYDRLGRSGRKGRWYIEKPTTAAMALRAACSGIENKRSHTHSIPPFPHFPYPNAAFCGISNGNPEY